MGPMGARTEILFFWGRVGMKQQRKFQILGFSFLWLFTIGLADVAAFQLGPQTPENRIKSMERPERVAELKPDQVISRLKLKPGDIVADIGAGAGAFAIPMAKAIAPNGTLYAVEIEQDFLDFINERVRKEDVGNIRTVLGEFNDPKLPVKDVDVAFFHRVLHHIERRAAYLDTLARYLKPTGRIAVIDKGPEDVDEGDWMWLKREDVDSWMAAIGFYPIGKYVVFADKWFVVYQRPFAGSELMKDD